MEVFEFMKEIGLPDRAISAVARIPFSGEEIASLPHAAYLNEPYAGDRPDRVLALFVRYLAGFSEEAYLRRGVTHGEWLDTMKDVAIWCGHLQRERGETGLRETAWLAHLVRTEIFRLGRLQFVPRRLLEELRAGDAVFPAGTQYAEVHIPEGERLLPSLADASFLRARELFAPRFFTCESWLLSPKLRERLKGGNILDFAARFRLLSVCEADRSAERYLFHGIADPHAYRPQNGFSAWVKEEAERGRFVGSAYGICVVS